MPDTQHRAVITAPNGVGGNSTAGPHEAPEEDRPPRPAGPSTRLALIVVGIAAFLLVLGTVGAALTSSQSKPTPVPHSVPMVAGAGLVAVSARTLLAPLVSYGEPPDNVLNAIVVPTGATVGGPAVNNGVSLYDESIRLVMPASQQAVITFMRAELPAEHWNLVDHGSAHTGDSIQIIGEHPGSDGNEWELGITVSPTAFATGSAASNADSTPVELRLFVETGDA